jgi:hypothetical protein
VNDRPLSLPTTGSWLLVHALAFIPPGLVAAAVTGLARPGVPAPLDPDLAMRLALVLSAVVLAVSQGRLLRGFLPGWAAASLAGAGLGATLAALIESALPDQTRPGPPWWMLLPGLWLPCLGLGAGLVQWTLLRHRVPHAGQWLPFSLLAWALSLPGAFLASGLISLPLAPLMMAAGALGGAQRLMGLAAALGVAALYLLIGPILALLLWLSLARLLRAAGPAPAAQTPVTAESAATSSAALLDMPHQARDPQLTAVSRTGAPASHGLLTRWLLAHLAAFSLAALLGGLYEIAVEPNRFQPGPPPRVVGDQALPAGLLAGLALAALAQARLLQRFIPGWRRGTLLGAAVGLALALAIVALRPSPAQVALAMPGGGLAAWIPALLAFSLPVALGQWLALRRHFSQAYLWILANLVAPAVAMPVGWMLSLFWGMPLAMLTTLLFSMIRAGDVGNFVGGLVLTGAGLVSFGGLAALVTGITLRWIRLHPAGQSAVALQVTDEPGPAGWVQPGS